LQTLGLSTSIHEGGLGMIGGLLFLAVSLVMVAFAGINLRNCVSNGMASAYGHPYTRVAHPVAFWISAACSVLAVLIGLALTFSALAGLLGLV
jgi:hypothetical protein